MQKSLGVLRIWQEPIHLSEREKYSLNIILTPYRNNRDFFVSRRRLNAGGSRNWGRKREKSGEKYTFNIGSEEDFLKMFEASPVLTMKGLEHDILLAERKDDVEKHKLYSRFYTIGLERMKGKGFDVRAFESFYSKHGNRSC
jgi:hypothetical protein